MIILLEVWAWRLVFSCPRTTWWKVRIRTLQYMRGFIVVREVDGLQGRHGAGDILSRWLTKSAIRKDGPHAAGSDRRR
jgi:hypothetical protein